MVDFQRQRRQPYLDEQSYANTLAHFEKDRIAYSEYLSMESASLRAQINSLESIANDHWAIFLLDLTAGVSPDQLAKSLEQVVQAFESYANRALELPDDEYAPAFDLDDLIDIYVDYLQLLSAAVLLRREDLVPRIFRLIEGTDYDGADAVIEAMLQFYLPDRPVPDEWLWNKPFDQLIKALDSPEPKERAKAMAKYVRSWYAGMKGRAHFWESTNRSRRNSRRISGTGPCAQRRSPTCTISTTVPIAKSWSTRKTSPISRAANRAAPTQNQGYLAMNKLFNIPVFALICFSATPAVAGFRSGPHILWVNLADNCQVEALIEKKLAEQDDCLAPNASFTPLPEWIPVELVEKAVFNKDKKAISSLDRLMRKRYDNYFYDGFDGIMVYDERSGSHLSNLVRGWKYVIRINFPSQSSKSSQWKEFCKLVPDITRPN